MLIEEFWVMLSAIYEHIIRETYGETKGDRREL
jgi:hypothetical protein